MHPRHAAKVANSGGFEKTEDEVSRNLGEILDRSDGLRNKFETSQHQHDIKNLYIASYTSRLGGLSSCTGRGAIEKLFSDRKA